MRDMRRLTKTDTKLTLSCKMIMSGATKPKMRGWRRVVALAKKRETTIHCTIIRATLRKIRVYTHVKISPKMTFPIASGDKISTAKKAATIGITITAMTMKTTKVKNIVATPSSMRWGPALRS